MPELKHPKDMTPEERRMELAERLWVECPDCDAINLIDAATIDAMEGKVPPHHCDGGRSYPLRVIAHTGWLPAACKVGQVAQAMHDAGWYYESHWPSGNSIFFAFFQKNAAAFEHEDQDPDTAVQVAALLALRGEKP